MKPRDIRFRLGAAFGLLVMVIVFVGWQGVSQLNRLHQQMQSIVEDKWVKVQLAAEARYHTALNNRITMQVFLLEDREEINRLLALRVQNSNRITELYRAIGRKLNSEREKQLLAAVEAARTPYVESYKQALVKLLDERKRDEAHAIMVQATLPRLVAYFAASTDFVQHENDEMNRVARLADRDFAAAQQQFLIWVILASLITLAIAVFSTSRVTRETSHRMEAEQSLQQAHDQLEQRVQERTAELSKEIAERKLVEDALRESEERFRGLSAGAQDAILMIDHEGKTTFWNAAAKRLLGYSSAEVLGQNLHNLIAPARFLSAHRKAFPKWCETGEGGAVGKTLELAARRKDGSEFPMELSLSCVRVGRYWAAIGIIRDITERKKVAETMAKSEAKYRALFESSRDAIMTTFPPDWKFTSANAATIALFRAKDEKQFISLGPWDLSPERQPDGDLSKDKAKRMLGTAMEQGSHFFEWVHQRLDGEVFPATVLLTRVELDGKTGLQATIRDVTELKRSEEKQRQLELRLHEQQKMAAIGTLAGGVGHEINNPIFGIMNYAQLIQDKLPTDSPLQKFAAAIGRESNRVARIVQQLIGFAQPKTETHSPARMADIVNAVLLLVASSFRNDQITIQVDVPKNLPEVPCSEQQIQQVLMSLLTNAHEASNARYPGADANKVIAINARQVEKEGAKWLRVTVEDHGIGIPPEIAQQVFDPFFTSKDRSKHSGSGLSMSAAVIRDHGGHLAVESQPERYTRSYFDLPMPETKTT
ncbi:MAG: PAS domain S-box protein [Verrucomicrobia bacterium]|nr:PAS domain S-box protein [Verrucomicrobiota bacterium]